MQKKKKKLFFNDLVKLIEFSFYSFIRFYILSFCSNNIQIFKINCIYEFIMQVLIHIIHITQFNSSTLLFFFFFLSSHFLITSVYNVLNILIFS